MRRIGILVVGLAWLWASEAVRADDRPNIVYVLADDMGFGDMGCENPNSKIPTPNMDRLATQSMCFSDAHAATALCTPSRYAILTGRDCWRGRLQHGVLAEFDPPLIEPGRLTVASVLAGAGYSTACIGKWHLGWDWPTTDGKRAAKNGINVDFTKPIANGPITRGFQYYFGVDLPNYPPYVFIENDRTVGIPVFPPRPNDPVASKRPGPMLPGWDFSQILPTVTDHACTYIENAGKQSARKPFFLYFAMTAPHFPIVPTAQFRGMSKAGDYGDYVCEVDFMLGRVMEAVEKAGLADNTILIFTSDNGPEVAKEVTIGAYDRILKYNHYSMGDWRGVKRDDWEGGHREPFMIRWPHHVAAGTINDETICHVDLMATAAAVAGAAYPDTAGEDSYNILPLFLGQKLDHPIRPATILASGSSKLGLRQGDWMFINARTADDNKSSGGEPDWFKKMRGYGPDDQPKELYNLRLDPTERDNVFSKNPKIAQNMLAILELYQRQGRSVGLKISDAPWTSDEHNMLAGWDNLSDPHPPMRMDWILSFPALSRPDSAKLTPIIGCSDDTY